MAASPLQAEPLAGNVYLVNPAVPSPFPDLGRRPQGRPRAEGQGLALGDPGHRRRAADRRHLRRAARHPAERVHADVRGRPRRPQPRRPVTPATRRRSSFNAGLHRPGGAVAERELAADATCPGSAGKRPKAKVKLGKLKSGKPKLGIVLKAGAAQLRNAKVVLPKGLKVGAKRKLKRGTEIAGGSVKGKGRKLSIKAKGGAVDRIKVQLSKGAVKARHGLGEKRLGPFKLRIRDADGKLTKLAVKAG